jgi:ribonuclease R
MTISEKEREASTIEMDYKARKYARWAASQLGREFKAKITATDPELRADLDDTIIGARLYITNNEDVVLFENVRIKIERVDLARAKIYAAIVGKAD